jgi:hypothetical protein
LNDRTDGKRVDTKTPIRREEKMMTNITAMIDWHSYAHGLDGRGLFAREPLTFNSKQVQLGRLGPGDHVWLVSRCPDDQEYYLVGYLHVEGTRQNRPGEPLHRYGTYSVLGDRGKSRNLGRQLPAETLLRRLRFESDKPIKEGGTIGNALQSMRRLMPDDEALLQRALAAVGT